MRVIGGKFKGRRLFSPSGNEVRPTTDKVKEAVFSILFSKGVIEGAAVLDLFCGSGGLGIEALSRGASVCVFADLSRESVLLTEKNLEHVRAERGSFEVYCADFRLALKKLSGRRFDIIFLDPPYLRGFELKVFELIARYGVLGEGGMIVFEHSLEIDLQNLFKGCIIDTRKFGSTFISLITFE